MAAPKWFEYQTYFDNKLAQMQQDFPQGDWTAESLTAAFVADGFPVDADGMYAHFEQWGNTLAENISPNSFFDVNYYMQSKLEQMQKTDPSYTMAQLENAFDVAGLTAWDHYTQWGFMEGINPSADFNTDEYMQAKLEQMQKTDPSYTMEQLDEAFKAADLNPIEHWFDWGIDEGLSYQPGEPSPLPPATEYTDVPLELGVTAYEGTADNENFVANLTTSSKTSTLTRDTTIDGDGGNDMLTVNMETSWNQGFATDNALTNVETVTLNNVKGSSMTFNATNTDGVQTWVLNENGGNINLTRLPEAGVEVDLVGLAGKNTASIEFAKGVTDGSSDAMTIGLDNVGTFKASGNKAANIKMAGIEDVTVDATGKNLVDLSGVSNATSLAATGAGDLTVEAVAGTVRSFDGGEATGNLNVNLTNANNYVKSVVMGAGDDKVTVSNLQATATVTGNEGEDEFIIQGDKMSAKDYRLTMTGVETLTVDNPNWNTTLVGTNIEDLQVLKMNDLHTNSLTLTEFTNGELTIKALGYNSAPVTINDIPEITLDIGNQNDDKFDIVEGPLTLADATNLTVHVQGQYGVEARFSGDIKAPNLSEMTIDNDLNAQTFELGKNSNLTNVSQLNVTGVNNVDLSAYNKIGAESENVTIDASTLAAEFKGEFSTSTKEASLEITGANGGINVIGITGQSGSGATATQAYSSISMTGGALADVIVFHGNGAGIDVGGDLGGGVNVVYVASDGSNWNTAISALSEENPNLNVGDDVSSGSITVTPDQLAEDSTNFKYIEGSTDVTIAAATGANKAENIDLVDTNPHLVFADGYTGPVTVLIDADDTVSLNSSLEEKVFIGNSAEADSASIADYYKNAPDQINNFELGVDKIGFASDGAFTAFSGTAAIFTDALSGTAADGAALADESGPLSASYSAEVSYATLTASIYLDDEATGTYDANAIANMFATASVASVTLGESASAAYQDDADAKLYLATDGQAMLVTGSLSNGYQMWYIDNNDGKEGIVSSEVTLIGTINAYSEDSTATLSASDFAEQA